jgi:hypothetical protein
MMEGIQQFRNHLGFLTDDLGTATNNQKEDAR